MRDARSVLSGALSGLALALMALQLAGCGGGQSVGCRRRRIFRRPSEAPRLSDPRHRRLQVPGRHRLEQGRRQRRQIRLDQGDRGRRPRRRALPGQLGGREGRGRRRTAPITSSTGAGRRWRRWPSSSRTRRSRRTPCPRCSTSRRRRPRRPASGISPRRAPSPQMKVMLDEMERHYGKRPVIYTTVDFYEAILADGAFMDYADLGALDEISSRGQDTDRAPGLSGNTSRTRMSPASGRRSTATLSTARKPSGRLSSRNPACGPACRRPSKPSSPARPRRLMRSPSP